MKEAIFGIPYGEIRRQCTADTLKRDSNSPLQKFSTVEPCIDGGTKILEDKELTALLRRIYRGSDRHEQ